MYGIVVRKDRGGSQMPRCEACGRRVGESDTVQKKVLRKVRDLCMDCGSKLAEQNEQAGTLA